MADFMLRWQRQDAAITGHVEQPQDWRAPVHEMIASLGGRMLRYFLTVGEFAGFAICEMPDEGAAVALTMISCATGRFEDFQMLSLFTPREAESTMERGHNCGADLYASGNDVP